MRRVVLFCRSKTCENYDAKISYFGLSLIFCKYLHYFVPGYHEHSCHLYVNCAFYLDKIRYFYVNKIKLRHFKVYHIYSSSRYQLSRCDRAVLSLLLNNSFSLLRVVLFCAIHALYPPRTKSHFIMLSCAINPNTIKTYKISQKVTPRHAARGVAQSPYPIYRHGKANLSKQPPWRAAGDHRLASSRFRVRAPGPAWRCAHFFLHPPFFPPSGDSYFRAFPTLPTKLSVRVNMILIFVHFHTQ